jgi:enoyl-CoA hydratase
MMTEATDAATTVVRYAEHNRVATITLDRPAARNALNAALVAQLDAALVRAEEDPGVGAIVLTATDPAFCAGLDIREFNDTGRPPAGVNELIHRIPTISKPSIGAINGPTMTGGLELALGLDILIASDRARFGDTHAKVGILPGGGMTARLPRAVGQRMAMEMSLTGRLLSADEALQHGLVTHVVAHEQLLERAQELGETIATRDPDIVSRLRQLYRVSIDGTLADGVAHEIAERDARRAAGNQLLPSDHRAP